MTRLIEKPVPIFIICRDRLLSLQQAIQSYQDCIASPIEIVIHDNGTTYGPTIEYLKLLESRGSKVYWNNKNNLESILKNINNYLTTNLSPYYIVTDPDIVLDNVNSDILEFYAFLLKEEKIQVIGPQLRIDDIPTYYPYRRKVLRIHQREFWDPVPRLVEYMGQEFKVINAAIDTTFGMYRRIFKFHRLNRGLRTYPPYAAKHLDWYLDPKNLSDDQKYYSESSDGGITHWSKFNLEFA